VIPDPALPVVQRGFAQWLALHSELGYLSRVHRLKGMKGKTLFRLIEADEDVLMKSASPQNTFRLPWMNRGPV
jgi:hypothetical protein